MSNRRLDNDAFSWILFIWVFYFLGNISVIVAFSAFERKNASGNVYVFPWKLVWERTAFGIPGPFHCLGNSRSTLSRPAITSQHLPDWRTAPKKWHRVVPSDRLVVASRCTASGGAREQNWRLYNTGSLAFICLFSVTYMGLFSSLSDSPL